MEEAVICPECQSDDIEFHCRSHTRHEIMGLEDGVLRVTLASDDLEKQYQTFECQTCGHSWPITTEEVTYYA